VKKLLAAAALMLALPAVAAARTGTEQFSFVTTSPVGVTFNAIGTGVFGDGGIATFPNNKSAGTIRFSRGTIKIKHSGGHATQSGSVSQCYFKQVTTGGHFTILSGTGAYKGITGSGKATVTFLDVQPIIKGKCQQNATPLAVQGVIKASGRVVLP
jgi:hypothetical protein